ncbi:MAG: hypothetical protein QXS96_00845 [Candidatus Caldarchaeum sp.]|jgi:hypothetical protein
MLEELRFEVFMRDEYQPDNYVLDVSAFLSIGHLRDMIEILNIAVINRERTTLILPTLLYHELKNTITKGEISFELKQILHSWTRRRAYEESSIKKAYIEFLKMLFQNFKIEPAERYVGGEEKIGEQTIRKDDIIKELGNIVGSIVFEILAVSYKLRCKILAFGNTFISLARKMKIATVIFSSKTKDYVKKKAGIRRTLRMLIYLSSLGWFQQFLTEKSLDPSIIVVGLLLIADG